MFDQDAIEPVFNPDATPFMPPMKKPSIHRPSSKVPILKVGPSAVTVNAHIWDAVANNRVLPTLPRASQIQIVPTFDFPQNPLIRAMSGLNISSRFVSSFITLDDDMTKNIFLNFLQKLPPSFAEDYSRNLVFTRNFGPVAHRDGYVELRLRDNIR